MQISFEMVINLLISSTIELILLGRYAAYIHPNSLGLHKFCVCIHICYCFKIILLRLLMLGTLSERNGMRIAPVWVTFLSFFSLSLLKKKNLGVCEANSKARKKKEENKGTFEF